MATEATTNPEGKLTLATKINYGIGTTGKSLSYGLNGRFTYYLLTVLRMDKRLQAPMLVAGRVWDGLNDLLMGTVIDNTRTKWGKFRPWIALGALANALAVVGLFGGPASLGERPMAQFAYVAVLFLLWDMTYTMVDVSYWAMIPALSTTPKERDVISMIPRVFAGVFGLATAFNMQIIEWLGKGDEVAGFRWFAIISSVIYVMTSLYSAATTKELRIAPPAEKKETIGLGKALSILVHNKQTLVTVAVMILFNLAANLTNGVALFYFKFVANNLTQNGFFGIMTGFAPGIGLVLFPLLNQRISRNKVYSSAFLLPMICYAGMAIADRFIPPTANPDQLLTGNFVVIMLSVLFGYIGYGFMSVMQNVMLADCVDYGEYETGKRNEGIIFCTLTMLSKLAGALNDLIVIAVFSVVKFGGQDAVVATPAAIKGISLLMYILPPVALVLSFTLYRLLYKLTPERMAAIRGSLEERKSLRDGSPPAAQSDALG